MSTPTVTITAPRGLSGREETVDRYEGVKQYSLAQIVAMWAAAALPMGVLAWIVAPALKDSFSGAGNVPMAKALFVVLTCGLVWQGVMVAGLVWLEQRSLRWSTLCEALWLRSPQSPKSGRVGGKLWLMVIPLILAYAAVPFLIPSPASPADRDMGKLLESDAGQTFLSGNWRWFGLLLVLWVFNTVLGEELLFRGLLLPRMNRVFGRGDWLANGVLFAAYHVHVPWVMPETLLGDTLLLAYPTKRYRSAWLGIIVHSAQSVVLGAIVLTFVL
jgi:membrane protease YdiL (CAAX protease family)